MVRQQKLDIDLPPETTRRKFEEKPRGSKQSIVIIFLITLGLSILFYLRGIMPKVLQDLTTPDKIIIEKGGE